MILTFHEPPLASGQRLCDINRSYSSYTVYHILYRSHSTSPLTIGGISNATIIEFLLTTGSAQDGKYVQGVKVDRVYKNQNMLYRTHSF